MKSLLFVPADSERKLAKAESCGADAMVIDLEDAVLPARKPLAREMLGAYAAAYTGKSELWVRVNDLASGELLKDLAAVVPMQPVGIVLPKISGPEDLDIVGYYLDMAEAANNVPAGQTKILAVCTETASAVLRMGELVQRHRPRLTGMLWGGEDLSTALGAGDPRYPDGRWRSMYEYARNQCLLACHSLGIEAIDTVYVDFRNPDGCRDNSLAARYDGFVGKVAIHPDQVPIINAAFTPSDDEIAHARKVIAAFAQGAGAVSLDGKMLDVPHLKSAQQMLRSAGLTQED
ncbi:HpcH/HpaI aldolase/citrate lyase family protein [Polycyclovorans algicola]|uniref:HpcH/HpaI aldolase/citrate lyase family protein n=1 Tax=Polycyclovorans algicola TaxID=616992 RepID=UPI0004A782B1|nr:CoA ester lyase [Polycyclovorans algicola]